MEEAFGVTGYKYSKRGTIYRFDIVIHYPHSGLEIGNVIFIGNKRHSSRILRLRYQIFIKKRCCCSKKYLNKDPPPRTAREGTFRKRERELLSSPTSSGPVTDHQTKLRRNQNAATEPADTRTDQRAVVPHLDNRDASLFVFDEAEVAPTVGAYAGLLAALYGCDNLLQLHEALEGISFRPELRREQLEICRIGRYPRKDNRPFDVLRTLLRTECRNDTRWSFMLDGQECSVDVVVANGVVTRPEETF